MTRTLRLNLLRYGHASRLLLMMATPERGYRSPWLWPARIPIPLPVLTWPINLEYRKLAFIMLMVIPKWPLLLVLPHKLADVIDFYNFGHQVPGRISHNRYATLPACLLSVILVVRLLFKASEIPGLFLSGVLCQLMHFSGHHIKMRRHVEELCGLAQLQ